MFLSESGYVERKPLWECYFCRKGSYESAVSISFCHCLVALDILVVDERRHAEWLQPVFEFGGGSLGFA